MLTTVLVVYGIVVTLVLLYCAKLVVDLLRSIREQL